VDHKLDQLISECENSEDEINEMEKVMAPNEQVDNLRGKSFPHFKLVATIQL